MIDHFSISTVNPHEVEERAYGIDAWARRVIRRSGRGSTTYVLTAANDTAIKMLNDTQHEYALHVYSFNGDTNYREGDDVWVAVRKVRSAKD